MCGSPQGSPGAAGTGGVGRTCGGAGLGSGARAGMSRAIAETWAVREVSVAEVEAVDALSSPISPVTRENADVSSELSLVN